MGRITGYDREKHCVQAYRLALLGATDAEIAACMMVGYEAFKKWKQTYPEFRVELNRGKMEADAKVAEALFHRAVGYEMDDVDVRMFKGQVIKTPIKKKFPPDSWACFKWLTLRQRAHWTDVKITESTQTNLNINRIDVSGLTTEELKMLKNIGLKQITDGTKQDDLGDE
ncbi:MAG TPA: hypothetical protein VMW20_04555 [Candidatus Nanoarchaeia archaeon]|nr:hypothetical protein [Candidatus Nanoarchaeia archaeon]